ncbi:MAG: sigma 54-interacting transcriptional regulator [Pirellulaceae bacterium]
MQQSLTAYLTIQQGNRWSDILRLSPEQTVLIGRSSECEIVVKDERVSRNHAEIAPQSGSWVVRDLGSRNGTLVNKSPIEGEHLLRDGEWIEVGECRVTFSLGLSSTGGPIGDDAVAQDQATREIRPTIVNRRANSQWSAEGIELPASFATGSDHSDQWSFFYRLISELVLTDSREAAAQVALDRLLEKLQLSIGGVLALSTDSNSTPENISVLATKQPQGASYRRISDFLLRTVARDKQAVLARNVQDDSKLSVARASGQRDIVSIICAPLRSPRDTSEDSTPADQTSEVFGLLHVVSMGDERMLSDTDLEIAVGVADNLAIALSRQAGQVALEQNLKASKRRVKELEQQLVEGSEMVGKSAALTEVRQSIQRAGPTSATVLVRGESGVGKELVARAIHAASPRKDGPLVCLNCAALAPTLLESELFGHEKGAFTGATDRKIGKFEAANKGTLLLDEIGEMSPELQAKFLRVLEGQPFERLGGNKQIKTDVRVIAATNRDLEEAVKEKTFRADLFFRLRVIEIYVPPLRDRKEDLQPLAEHFIEQLRHHAARRIQGIDPEALELLTRHNWPGNVRELRNVLERAIVLGIRETIVADDLSLVSFGSELGSENEPGGGSEQFLPIPLAELEKAHIFAMLEHTEGNKTRAAQLLGIERSTLDRKLKKY